jgi:hypothetical protein
MPKGESKTSPRRIEAAEKHVEALQLRKAGATYQQIADTLGYSSISGAEKAVKTALAGMIHEPAAELIILERSRLDALLMAVWGQAVKGNQGAIDRALRIMERRARLLGLDAPVRTDVTVNTWEDKVIALLRDGKITPEQARAELGTSLAEKLFNRAGISVSRDS